MTGRTLDSATATALDSSTLIWVYIVRLDIVGDPVLSWTGYGDLTFGAGATGDTALDGLTFDGLAHATGAIGSITDGQGGSQALELIMPGVDLTNELLRQVVYNRATWQFRPAWVWAALMNPDGTIIGKPFRLKTGRIDMMDITDPANGDSAVKCRIESAQAYAGEALNTRYSEQKEIDPLDTSQDAVWSIANMTPALGQASAIASTGNSGGAPMNSGRMNAN